MIPKRVLGSVRARVTALVLLSSLPLLLIAAGLALEIYRNTLPAPGGESPEPATSASQAAWSRAGQDAAQAGLVRHLVEIIIALGIGLIIVGGGINQGVVRPLRALTGAVERWRGGGTFDDQAGEDQAGEDQAGATMPTELAELSGAFRQATGALAQREADLRAAISQHELLLQEIHHRVKNNLQIVASLLNLQANRIRLPEAKAEFEAARDRVSALATLHRHLYADGELRSINMRSFLTELCQQLFHAMGERKGERIQLAIDAPELQMASDQAVPLALIVTEAVSNAVKYAFPGGRAGHVSVRLSAEPGADAAHLVVEDDGIGIPEGQGESESGPRDGLGIHLIRGFSRQLGAELTVHEGNGTRYDVTIPLQAGRPDPSSAASAEREAV